MPQWRPANTHTRPTTGESKWGRDWRREVGKSDLVILNGEVDWATLGGSDVLVATLSSIRSSLLEATNQSPPHPL